MKKSLSAALLLAGGLAVHSAQAACTYPVAPGAFPDGNVASREEIKAAKDTVTKYDADMNSYLVCIRGEYEANVAALPADAPKKQKTEMEKMFGKKEDAALAEVQDVVARFNEQLKAWKAKNMPEKKSS